MFIILGAILMVQLVVAQNGGGGGGGQGKGMNIELN